MKYFLDTEFHEYPIMGHPTIELISIGMVSEDGRELYLLSNQCDLDKAFTNDWLRENVLMPIYRENRDLPFSFSELRDVFQSNAACSNAMIRDTIVEFVSNDEDEPEFYGYYADYDWVVFCWLFGRMIDLPKNFPMYCRDLKQMLDDYAALVWLTAKEAKQLIGYPSQENEHNALADARWNLKLYKFLIEYDWVLESRA